MNGSSENSGVSLCALSTIADIARHFALVAGDEGTSQFPSLGLKLPSVSEHCGHPPIC